MVAVGGETHTFGVRSVVSRRKQNFSFIANRTFVMSRYHAKFLTFVTYLDAYSHFKDENIKTESIWRALARAHLVSNGAGTVTEV